MTHRNLKQKQGFALLMTLIVVGIVISVGLTILDLSLKQISLSTNSRDSEVAFHAANAGLECIRHWRRVASTTFESGSDVTVSCFDAGGVLFSNSFEDDDPIPPIPVSNPADGEVYRYQAEITWAPGTGRSRCSEYDMIIMRNDFDAPSSIILGDASTPLSSVYPGYIDRNGNGDTKECEPGASCTLVSVRGYNKPCNAKTEIDSIQREVLLEF